MKHFILTLFVLVSIHGTAQIKPENGLAESKPAYYALKNATIAVSPTESIRLGTILIKGDKIEQIGMSGLIMIPKDAVVIDCSDKFIFPAFIEMNSEIGMPKVEKPKSATRNGAYHWNYSIHPEVNAAGLYQFNKKQSDELITMGFGFAMTFQHNGIARGKTAFVSLGEGSASYLSTLASASAYSLKKGASPQGYPSSQMGSIALLRQAFHDTKWYKTSSQEHNLSYEALADQMKSQMFFETADKLEILRAQKIAEEFGLTFNYFGSGNEYEIVDQLKEMNSAFVLPVNFPAAYDVQNPYITRQIPLSDLKHWEMAPQNPSILAKKNIPICLSSKGTKPADFWNNIRSAIKHGLTVEQALNALTLEPAKLLGAENLVGSLEKGKLASFMIYDKNPFTQKAALLESWLLGERTIQKSPSNDYRIVGTYNISFDGNKFPLEITKKGNKLSGKLTYARLVKGVPQDTAVNVFVSYTKNDITLQFNIRKDELIGNVSLRGKVNNKMGVFEGEGLLPNGKWVGWTGIRKKKNGKKEKPGKSLVAEDTLNASWYPNMAYGFQELPTAEPIVIKNATLWTNEEDGIIENASIVIKEGKIVFVGTGNPPVPSGAKVIDAKGKHVTSGIIDEHSHIAISKGVNEGGQAISAEVSIGHVVNSKDINIYRQLSGGVTAAQLLHGSANPIGGQSALIKLKWGFGPNDMLIDDAPGFIKFALGENVKHSNWGSRSQFPQTRMGVEQVYYDGFTRAKAYQAEWEAFENGESQNAPRVDLELEALVEILESRRFISCHSYVQSEINMLMHVADSMGFTVNTFTHILEGYKLADKMAAHGVGGSTFSDWWAYKYEVNDAIPYNAKLMMDQGVVVAINSDDAEMGRRLNQEAAKSVKYGGMSEEDAWKMVTLNPAKLLHLDDRMGSLIEGKDADIVIWSANPLSIEAKVEQTIVDGMILYDAERDQAMRIKNQEEKARIVSKMLDSNKNGGKKRPFFKKRKGHFHCDTIGEEASLEENHH
jgi:imidazolonepropionase-like amidohydrolase